jgi:hypothetical protein
MRRKGVGCSVLGAGGKRKKPKPSAPGLRRKSTTDWPVSCDVPEEDGDWRLLTYQQFLRGYSREDAIYAEYDKRHAG